MDKPLQIEIPKNGVEYAHIKLGNVPVDPPADLFEASIDNEVSYHTLTYNSTLATYDLLIASPRRVDPPPAAAVGLAGTNPIHVRMTDNPEVVIRNAGIIYCE